MNALDQPIAVTFFPSFAAPSKTEEPYTPRTLAERIRAETASRKDVLPWLKLARFGTTRTGKSSLRHDANVLAVTGIEADYDDGKMTFDAACALLEKQGIASIVYTSPSHSLAKPRWRVLCPLSEEMPPQRRSAMLGRLNGLFGGIFAGESWTLSQAYYYGSIDCNPAHHVELIDGATIDTHDDLDVTWRGKCGSTAVGKDTNTDDAKEPREDAELIRRIVTGEGLHVELCALAARYTGRGMSSATVVSVLQGIMQAHPETSRTDRWKDRFASIGELVQSASAKYEEAAAARVELRRKLAGLALSLLREGIDESDVLACLDAANGESTAPLPTERIGNIAIWAAGIVGGINVSR